jgi:hypothetical protein
MTIIVNIRYSSLSFTVMYKNRFKRHNKDFYSLIIILKPILQYSNMRNQVLCHSIKLSIPVEWIL